MCDTMIRFASSASHMCDIVDPYTCTSWLLIIYLSTVDYPYYFWCSYICFICVQVNMCDILRKRKACCKKCMGHNKGFSNLTVIAIVFPVKNFLYKNIYKYINISTYINIYNYTQNMFICLYSSFFNKITVWYKKKIIIKRKYKK